MHEQSVRTQTMKIVIYSMDPHQGLSAARRAGFFLNCCSRSTAGATLRGLRQLSYMEVCKKISYHTEQFNFHGKCSITTKRSRGFHPRRCGSPDAITPEQVLGIIVRAGASWGDRHSPLLHSYQHLEFHINGKGILQSQKKYVF